MDLAKMMAVLQLIEPLTTDTFRIWRQTRTGLLSYPVDGTAARAHLAASVYLQMALRPHIVHVVSHTEATHAATADDVIEACGLARRSIENALRGAPDMTADPKVQARAAQLAGETRALLEAIGSLADSGTADPLADPPTLAKAVAIGLMDAPQLRSNHFAPGRVITRIIDGACLAVDSHGRPIEERARIQAALAH
jgi:hypothetical protein